MCEDGGLLCEAEEKDVSRHPKHGTRGELDPVMRTWECFWTLEGPKEGDAKMG